MEQNLSQNDEKIHELTTKLMEFLVERYPTTLSGDLKETAIGTSALSTVIATLLVGTSFRNQPNLAIEHESFEYVLDALKVKIKRDAERLFQKMNERNFTESQKIH